MATINHDHSSCKIALELERRRKALGISRQLLAQRSGVSLPTVTRILCASVENSTFANLKSVARALGMDFEIKEIANPQEFAEQQARSKAKKIASLVQGTSALESQAVDDETYNQIISQTTHELMAGSRRRLWSR
jgi:transcriptional regulator with XRE-family HTH domain